MKSYLIITFTVLSCLLQVYYAFAQERWSPDHVYYGPGGKLTYTPDEQGNTIPDFSHVGYRYGDESIPDVPVVVEVSPVEGDDGAVIQSAINSLYSRQPDENGFRGAVLLKRGTYQVSGQIKIGASGIVLRGEGDTDEGTVIIAEGTSDRDLIRVDNGASLSVISSSRVPIVESYVPVGQKYVVVSNTTGYAAGNHIVIYRPGTSQWISDLKMNQITATEGVVQWSPSGFSFYFERLITRVNGDTLFFRNPLVMALETQYGGGAVYKYSFNRIQNVGIENLCLKSAYKSNTDEAHSWNAIAIYSAEHSWVRHVTSWYFAYSCVNMSSKSKLITVENCHYKDPKSVITGGRRYSFNINGSLCLVKNCTTSHGRHDYVNGARVTGPNVFTSSTAVDTHSDIGPHHRWAMGTLFDVIVSDGSINVQDRDNSGTGHGWAGANTVFWNSKGSSSICQSPWVSAKNYNFGFQGSKSAGNRPNRPDGVWVGHNQPGIFPSSLYEAQLDERLNGTSVFSAIAPLVKPNDTALMMQFTLPLNPEQISRTVFDISGTTALTIEDLNIVLQDERSVILSSKKLRNIPDLTTITVKVKEITSLEGQSLQGLTSLTYTYPDQRPVVTGTSAFVDNIEGTVEAVSTKPGYIYLVKYGLNITTQRALDSLIQINQGRNVVVEAGTPVTISTKGLPGDYYQYYAVDQEQRVSLPATNWISVQQLGPVTGTENPVASRSLAWQWQNGQLRIDPGHDRSTSIAIYSITGEVIYSDRMMPGIRIIQPKVTRGVFIILEDGGQGSVMERIVLY